MLHKTADFSAAVWQPYQSQLPWSVEPYNGRATVFVQLRDAAGNESEIESVSFNAAQTPTAIASTKTGVQTGVAGLVPTLLLVCGVTWLLLRRRRW